MAQRQSALFEHLALQHLANATDWSCFEISDQAAWINALNAAAGSQPSQLLLTLAPVLSRGMQLLSEQQLDVTTLRQHQQGVRTVLSLLEGWVQSQVVLLPQPEQSVAIAIAVQMTRTGMLKAYGQLCSTLTRFISSHAANDAAAAAAFKRSSILAVIVPLLDLLGQVVGGWPGNRALGNPAVAAAVPAVAELAVAALRNTKAEWTAPPDSSSQQLVSHKIARAAVGVANAIYAGSTSSVGDTLAVGPDYFAASSAVMQLMMAPGPDSTDDPPAAVRSGSGGSGQRWRISSAAAAGGGACIPPAAAGCTGAGCPGGS